ncbi:cell division protein FtsQ/DivIB [Leptospira alstonii]|uniref:POTRA domain protein, FtsQ-type n=2 Tax=Leptospira alstonii TaxID=28452 RepID=M6CZH2_9LEPT|nr:FtsQ-type POTRA domain-containing protein [Leptospira alstonii]EMJ91705.1 POTRA domain protein, FtsQ-type [Leptospira alstonii serovar Sichuan str. 79601]EQA79637.1 POTRA domain protein, FtsQ-type [Leptospira alstonii serovar Pingchang str. 80-412]
MRHNLIDFLQEFVQKRRNILLLALLIGILSVVGMILGFGYQGMIPRELNKLIITGHEKLRTEEIVRMLEIQPGTSFDTLDLDLLEKKLSRLPRVNFVRITKKSEDQLLIELTERKADYVVNSDGHLYEIDSELRLLSKDDVREKDLCVLSGNFPVKNGAIQDASFRDLYNSVEQAFRMYPALKPRISEVLLQEDGEIFFFADEPIQLRIQIGTLLHKDQVRKLYAILAYFEKDRIQSELVDIRGEDAVYH